LIDRITPLHIYCLAKNIGDKKTIYLTYNTLTRKITTSRKQFKPKHNLAVTNKLAYIMGYNKKEALIDSAKGLAQESPYVATLNTFSTIDHFGGRKHVSFLEVSRGTKRKHCGHSNCCLAIADSA
jgi:hypothetical protein